MKFRLSALNMYKYLQITLLLSRETVIAEPVGLIRNKDLRTCRVKKKLFGEMSNMNLRKHAEEMKEINVKMTDDCVERKCHKSLFAFCYWERKRELEYWGECSVLLSTGGLKKDGRECTRIQEHCAKLRENE